MTIEEHSKARLHGAKWALGLDVKATVEEIEAARNRIHTSITMRADRCSGAPCVGDSRLTIETIANMDRETCRRDFPQVTDDQWQAVRAWLETNLAKAAMGACRTVDDLRDQLAAVQAAKVRSDDRLRSQIRELTQERDNLLSDLIAQRDELAATIKERDKFAAAWSECHTEKAKQWHQWRTTEVERDEARQQLVEARRLHANAVEELARVKMGTITAEQIELFIWRSGWHDEFSATSNEVERFAKSLAQHLRGAP